MRRPVLAIALACVLLLGGVSVSNAGSPPYEHVWQAEGMFSGDLGSTARSVVTDEMELMLTGAEWDGRIVYADVLGLDESGSVSSQVCSMTLDLRGTSIEGGAALGGRFTGVAELTVREAGSVAAAADPVLAAAPGGQRMVYEVSGFWSARLEDRVATGELLFRTASPLPGGSGPMRDASWFNRANLAQPDGLGDAQTFSTLASGVAATGGSTSATRTPPGDYITRGLRGTGGERPTPASSAQAAAAQALLKSAPAGATPLPPDARAIDLDVAGAFLDAKNRAAGLLDEQYHPTGPWVQDAIAGADAIMAAEPRHDAATADEGIALADRIKRLIAQHAKDGVPGAAALLTDLDDVVAGADDATLARLRAWAAAVGAIAVPPSGGSALLIATQQAASAVADEPVAQSGPLAGAARAAADSPTAPRSSRVVTAFERISRFDTSATAGSVSVPSRVRGALASSTPPGGVDGTPIVTWEGGARSVAPARWLAYRRNDGRVYWLAGDNGPVALTDAGIEGWAWRTSSAALVDALAVGRVLETYRLPPVTRPVPAE